MYKVRKKHAGESWRCCGLYTAGEIYFWLLHRRTNYSLPTAKLGVTLSNFYPILCVHTPRAKLSICVFISLTDKGEEKRRGRTRVSCLCLCSSREYVCVSVMGLCWPAWLRVNQSCWVSVSHWPHLLQRSCKLLPVPGCLLRWGVN